MSLPRSPAFSLVEVVLALGIFAFCGLSLLGLFSVGLSSNQESTGELEATHLAQAMIGLRRVDPISPTSVSALPPLDTEASVLSNAPILITEDGSITTNREQARFSMMYRVSPDPSGSKSHLFLCLSWPAAKPMSAADGRYETSTVFTLPPSK